MSFQDHQPHQAGMASHSLLCLVPVWLSLSLRLCTYAGCCWKHKEDMQHVNALLSCCQMLRGGVRYPGDAGCCVGPQPPPHLKGIRWACCSATHSRVMVAMLNRRCTHQQLSLASMPARIARTLHAMPGSRCSTGQCTACGMYHTGRSMSCSTDGPGGSIPAEHAGTDCNRSSFPHLPPCYLSTPVWLCTRLVYASQSRAACNHHGHDNAIPRQHPTNIATTWEGLVPVCVILLAPATSPLTSPAVLAFPPGCRL